MSLLRPSQNQLYFLLKSDSKSWDILKLWLKWVIEDMMLKDRKMLKFTKDIFTSFLMLLKKHSTIHTSIGYLSGMDLQSCFYLETTVCFSWVFSQLLKVNSLTGVKFYVDLSLTILMKRILSYWSREKSKKKPVKKWLTKNVNIGTWAWGASFA